MKVIKFLLPVIFAAFLFGTQSCNKYEEGPAISLRTKKARVVNEWDLKEVYKNGAKQDLDETIEFVFKDDYTGYWTEYDDNDSDTQNFKWEFNSDKTKIIITSVDDDGNIHEDEVAVFTIIKLYENEMWLTQNRGEDDYEYHFKNK